MKSDHCILVLAVLCVGCGSSSGPGTSSAPESQTVANDEPNVDHAQRVRPDPETQPAESQHECELQSSVFNDTGKATKFDDPDKLIWHYALAIHLVDVPRITTMTMFAVDVPEHGIPYVKVVFATIDSAVAKATEWKLIVDGERQSFPIDPDKKTVADHTILEAKLSIDDFKRIVGSSSCECQLHEAVFSLDPHKECLKKVVDKINEPTEDRRKKAYEDALRESQ